LIIIIIIIIIINHTQEFSILWPDLLKAKAKAARRRGLGQGSSMPRPQNFVLEVEASPWGPHPWFRQIRQEELGRRRRWHSL